MFRTSALLFAVLGAVTLGAVAAPPAAAELPKLRFKRAATAKNGAYNVVEADRARIAHLMEEGARYAAKGEPPSAQKRASYSFDVTNALVTYTASVGVGSPPTYYDLVIDTGSSNTWIGANKPYKPTGTSTSTGKSVSVTYGSGSFSGTEYIDTVTLSPDLVITKQSIGVASQSKGFDNYDGILGIGPVFLTLGSVSGEAFVPTVTDNLYTQKTISSNAVGVYFEPITPGSAYGELTFGGADPAKCNGDLNWVPLTLVPPAKFYWGIDQSVSYGGTPLTTGKIPGIVDTGTTLIYLPPAATKTYMNLVGAVPDDDTGLLRIPPSNYSKLKTLTFKVNGKTYDLIPNAQIWPRSMNTAIGGTNDYIYLVVNSIGDDFNVTPGLQFINGYTWLERFYTVYDTTNHRIGIATTKYTNAETN